MKLKEAMEKRPSLYDKCNKCIDKEKCLSERILTYNLPKCVRFKEEF
jgi:hypothetical protein